MALVPSVENTVLSPLNCFGVLSELSWVCLSLFLALKVLVYESVPPPHYSLVPKLHIGPERRVKCPPPLSSSCPALLRLFFAPT